MSTSPPAFGNRTSKPQGELMEAGNISNADIQ